MIPIFFTGTESDVQKKKIEIAVSMLYYVYVAAGVFMVLENFEYEKLNRGAYTPHVSMYFILMTISTIGYGEYSPRTPAGRILMIFVIIYVLVIKFTTQLNDLIRLMDLKSTFQQAVYISNPEVQHLVITGQVKLTALKNVALELFHPDHGNEDRHAVVLQ